MSTSIKKNNFYIAVFGPMNPDKCEYIPQINKQIDGTNIVVKAFTNDINDHEDLSKLNFDKNTVGYELNRISIDIDLVYIRFGISQESFLKMMPPQNRISELWKTMINNEQASEVNVRKRITEIALYWKKIQTIWDNYSKVTGRQRTLVFLYLSFCDIIPSEVLHWIKRQLQVANVSKDIIMPLRKEHNSNCDLITCTCPYDNTSVKSILGCIKEELKELNYN